MKLTNASLFREQCYINGQWVDADNGKTFPVTNPFDGSAIGTVPLCERGETRKAIEAAQKAFEGWRKRSARERSDILTRFADLIDHNIEDLAIILTTEQGKPLEESRGEIRYGNDYIRWFAAEAVRAYGDVIPALSAEEHIIVIQAPIGVAAAITPWNFPNAMMARKLAPALAAGCPIVIKPAEDTPYSALALAVLAEEAGIPPGVFNIITGVPKEIGAEMTSNPIVRKLTFTGSTPVGKLLMRQSADTVKKTSMELGGNAPFIVFESADIEQAVQGTLAAKFRNSGQTCVCANRILVQSSIYDAFSKRFAEVVSELKLGNGLMPGVTQGPLINQAAIDKVSALVKDATQKGAKVLLGAKPADAGKLFYEPTVLTHIKPDMSLVSDEIFGPVAPLMSFETEAEAIAHANNTPFGLASYFFTRDLGQSWRVAEALDYGMVGINTGRISNAAAPFGGVKESGLGREGSKYGIEEYMVKKYLCVRN